MPNRVLSDEILTDEAVSSLSADAEVFYRRLYSAVDDHGRFDGRPSMLQARLYPLRADSVGVTEIEAWLAECCAAGLVSPYTVNDRRYVFFHGLSAPRSKTSQYPAPPSGIAPESVGWSDRNKYAKVYFIRDDAPGAIKIGSAIDPKGRMASLQTSCPATLTLLGAISGGQAREKELHARFATLRIRGEWFTCQDELKGFLEQQGFLPTATA